MSVLLPVHTTSLNPRGLCDHEHVRASAGSSGRRIIGTKLLTSKDQSWCLTPCPRRCAKAPCQQTSFDELSYSSSDEERDAEDDEDFCGLADSDIVDECNDLEDDVSTTDASTVFSLLTLGSNVSERSHRQGNSSPRRQGARRKCLRFTDVPPQVFVYEKARVHERFLAFYSREELCSIMLEYYRETCLGLEKDNGQREI